MLGVLLAGGQARRMGGGDKGLRLLGGRPLLDHVIARAKPQVGGLVLNANGDPERFRPFSLPVEADPLDGFAGPLAGVLAGMTAAKRMGRFAYVMTFACDTPFFPTTLVHDLRAALTRAGADLACAASGGRDHPVFGLFPLRLYDSLRAALTDEGVRKVDVWTQRHRLTRHDYPVQPFDPFFNANRPEDLAAAERLRSLSGA